MTLNRISLIVIPLMTMFLAGLISTESINQSATFNFQSENVTVNNEQQGLTTSQITFTNILAIATIISIALAIVLVVSVKVLGSGISGSVIPILFMVTIMTGVYVILSGVAYPVFATIPIFGQIIFFGLCVMYVLGIAGLAVGTGGD